MNIEIELRYEIINEALLSEFTTSLTLLDKKRIIDVYFDTPNADLIEKGIYIRIRNNQKIDIKFNRDCLANPSLELQPYCEEYTFMVPFRNDQLSLFHTVNNDLGLKYAITLDEYKNANNLIDHRVVDKIRTIYQAEDFVVSIDNVKELGTFLEIELMANNADNIETITNRMKKLLSTLQLKPLKTGYDSLILRKQNFQQYLKGRFALPEDRAVIR